MHLFIIITGSIFAALWLFARNEERRHAKAVQRGLELLYPTPEQMRPRAPEPMRAEPPPSISSPVPWLTAPEPMPTPAPWYSSRKAPSRVLDIAIVSALLACLALVLANWQL